MSRVLVVAEPGGTAEGDFGAMVELIHVAKQCDADVFKAQWTSNPAQMCERRHITADHPNRAYYLRAYSWLAFPVEWHAELARECENVGLQYACTSFLPQDVVTVDPFVSMHKIASFENANGAMRRACHDTGKEYIRSTGGTSAQDWNYIDSKRESILLCTSAYPAPLDQLNLSLLTMCHGLSDHSRDIDMGGFAVCAGAKIIEAHFRLDSCNPENPDYAVAFTPREFAEYVGKIRKAEVALGDGVKRVQPSEEWALPYKVTA